MLRPCPATSTRRSSPRASSSCEVRRLSPGLDQFAVTRRSKPPHVLSRRGLVEAIRGACEILCSSSIPRRHAGTPCRSCRARSMRFKASLRPQTTRGSRADDALALSSLQLQRHEKRSAGENLHNLAAFDLRPLLSRVPGVAIVKLLASEDARSPSSSSSAPERREAVDRPVSGGVRGPPTSSRSQPASPGLLSPVLADAD